MAVDFAQLLNSVIQFIPRLISALVLFLLGIVLSRLLSRCASDWAEKRIQELEIRQLITRLVRWSMLIAFTIAALDQVDFDVTAFLAGLGIAGMTIGFALQDIARNFIAGIIVMVRRPFQIGDAVKLGDYTGQVLRVSTRDTTLATWDGERVFIPNLEVLQKPISNYSIAPRLRRTIKIGLGYEQDVERARKVFLDAVAKIEGVLTDPAPMIHAEELGNYAITLALRYWVDHHESNVFNVSSAVIVALDHAAATQGLELPYPIQSVRVTNLD